MGSKCSCLGTITPERRESPAVKEKLDNSDSFNVGVAKTHCHCPVFFLEFDNDLYMLVPGV
jgi:hypothetical protein